MCKKIGKQIVWVFLYRRQGGGAEKGLYKGEKHWQTNIDGSAGTGRESQNKQTHYFMAEGCRDVL